MPSINFLLNGGNEHSNSITLSQMGIELTTYFLYMTQQESYEKLGHFTNDNKSTAILVSNLFNIMTEDDFRFISPHQKELCLKLAYRIISLYSLKPSIEIFTRLFTSELKSDMNKGILIRSIILPVLIESGDPFDEKDAY